MRRSPFVVLTLAGLMAVMSCAAEPPASPGRHAESEVAMEPKAAEVSFEGAASGMRALGEDLAGVLPRDKGNLVYSPASLALAFAMLREGAKGDTADQIDEFLHLPPDRQQAFNALLHDLADAEGGDILEIAEGAFASSGYPIRPEYLDTIKRWYGAGIEQTSFPDPGLTEVNNWVDEQTHGRIKELFDYLDPLTVLVLVNTIYLDAKWETPFDKEDTEERGFTTDAGDVVMVKTMETHRKLDYANGDGWQAVRLPYRDGTMSMWVLLPESGDPAELLSADVLEQAERSFSPSNVGVALPRWDLATELDLRKVLTEMGMQAAFGGQACDYSGIGGAPGDLVVDQVVQKANITVGEKGTVAAAATGISVTEVSAQAPPEFRADHPFAFVIMHDTTGVPLFEGTVGDPS